MTINYLWTQLTAEWSSRGMLVAPGTRPLGAIFMEEIPVFDIAYPPRCHLVPRPPYTGPWDVFDIGDRQVDVCKRRLVTFLGRPCGSDEGPFVVTTALDNFNRSFKSFL